MNQQARSTCLSQAIFHSAKHRYGLPCMPGARGADHVTSSIGITYDLQQNSLTVQKLTRPS